MWDIRAYFRSVVPRLRYSVDAAPANDDTPSLGSELKVLPLRQFVPLRGWCFFPSSQVLLELRLGKETLDCMRPSEERTDVHHSYPLNVGSKFSGFSFQVPSALCGKLYGNLQLRLIAHYGRRSRVIWHQAAQASSLGGSNSELVQILNQYFPERIKNASRQELFELAREKERGQTPQIHAISDFERTFLAQLWQQNNPVAFVFGANESSNVDNATWDLLASQSLMEKFTLCRVSAIDGPAASEKTPYDVSLRSLIEYQQASPRSGPFVLFVLHWSLIRDSFLCKQMLGGGAVFHLLDDTVIVSPETLPPVDQAAFRFALRSYAIPLYSSTHLEESLKNLLPKGIKPILVSDLQKLEEYLSRRSTGMESSHLLSAKIPSSSLSIVIPVFNALESTKRCLASAVRAIGKEDFIVVVDDCSDTQVGIRLEEFCKQDERITYVRRATNGGFIEACYSGLEVADSDTNILLLNSDVVLPVDAVKKTKAAIKDNPDIALASPLSTGSYTLSLQPIPGHSLEDLNRWLDANGNPAFPTVITPEGQCLFISRDAINRFGFFDRVYERGFCEESDFGMRVALHGGRLACFDSFVVFHEQSASFHHKVRDVLYEKNRFLFEARWGDYFSYLTSFHQITPRLDELRSAYQSAFQGDYPGPSEGHKIEDVLGGSLQQSVIKRGAQRAMSLPEDSDIVFVLPSVVRGGGSLSVLQHANEMALRGERVKIISLSPVQSGIYPSLVEVLDITPEGLLELPWSEQRLIATFWSTAYPIAEICRRNPRVQGWYYVQDYEPWFHHGHSDVVQAAEKSYELGLQLVAKTGFLKTLIEERHNVRVNKISPGIATDVFYPGHQEKNSGRPRVAALYRPETPRRGSRELLEVIEVAHKMMPELEFTLFGSTEGLPQKLARSVHLAGKLSQREVAELYRTTDIVVDLSHWHGFGRMGVEAMAAGAVPILSDSGGIHEYAIDGENSIICDPSNPCEIAELICSLALDREYRLRLRETAISTAEKLTESHATDNWLKLLNNAQQTTSGNQYTSTRDAYS